VNTSSAKAAPTAQTPYDRLTELGIKLPPPPPPIANFVTHVREGNMLYLSGQGPREADGHLHAGKVGADVGVDLAYQHARLVGINLLAVMHEALGDLSRVKRVVKLLGMVNAVPDFEDHPRSSTAVRTCSSRYSAMPASMPVRRSVSVRCPAISPSKSRRSSR